MVETPREGHAYWAAIYAASRRRPEGPPPRVGFERLSDAKPSAPSPGELPTRPELSGVEGVLPQDGLHERAAERAELGAWLRKLVHADDRAFKPSEQAEIRREIQALHAEVRTLTELNRHQQEAIDQLLDDVQRGSERMGRKDWITYAIGAGTSLIIMEIVPPLALLPLAVHAFHALGHLLIDV